MENQMQQFQPAQPPGQSTSEYVAQDEINLRHYLQILWRRGKVIAASLILIMGLVGSATLLMTPVYKASAILVIDTTGGNTLSLQNLFTADSSSSLMGTTEEINTEVEVMKSRQVAVETVSLASYQLDLDQSERVYQRVWRRLSGMAHSLFSSKQPSEEAAAAKEGPTGKFYVELLKGIPISDSVSYDVSFGKDGAYKVANEDGRVVAQGEVGKPCQTRFFTMQFQGPPPAAGTVYPVTYRSVEDATQNVLDSLRINPVRNSRLVELDFLATHPDQAERLLAALLTAYRNLKIQQKTQEASKALEFVNQQIGQVDVETRRAWDALKGFKEQSQVVSLSDTAKAALDKMVDLEKARHDLKANRQQAEFLLRTLDNAASVDEKSLYSLGNAMNQPLLIQYAGDLSKLQAQRAATRIQYTEKHPAIRAIDQQVTEMKGKIRAEVSSLTASLDSQLATLEQESREAEKGMERLPDAEQRLAELARKAKAQEDTYGFLLAKKGELQVTRASQLGGIWVVDPAYAETKAIKPRLVMNVLLAMVFGLAIGVFLAFVLEYLDDTVKNADDVQAVVRVPVLGTIGRHQMSENGRPASAKARYLPVIEDPKSPTAEAFRTFRSNLLFTGVDQPRKLILITSPLPGDGKSTCSANLAASLAQMGKKILLVDADLRKPVQHRTFGLKRSPGLVNILIDKNWRENIDSCIQQTSVENLHFLACGDVPPNPNEMLGSEKMHRIIEALGDRYDYVLFDTPPATSVSDSLVLARQMHGVLLVVRGGRTNRGAMKLAVELLGKARTDILGIVLNDVDFRRERYYYSYYYQYYSAYGEGAKDRKDGKGGKRRHREKHASRPEIPGESRDSSDT